MDETCIECQAEYTRDADLDHSYCPKCGVKNPH